MYTKADLSLLKHPKIKSYREILTMFLESGFAFFTHAQYFENPPYVGKAMYLRHDVDRNIDTALIMARIEHELGIRSTYFFLPPGSYEDNENYYGAIIGSQLVVNPKMIMLAQDMVGLGHEIGLHNDFVQLASKLGRDVGEVLAEQIAFFKKVGIPIKGTAAHGSKFVKSRGFVNYQIFSECKKAKDVAKSIDLSGHRTFDLFSVSYKALGLEYEAYSIQRDSYISDSGASVIVNNQAMPDADIDTLKTMIADKTSVVALFHPDWWKSPGKVEILLSRLKSNMQSFIN